MVASTLSMGGRDLAGEEWISNALRSEAIELAEASLSMLLTREGVK